MKFAFAFLTVVVVLVGMSGCNGLGGFLSPHGRTLIDGSCGHCTDCPETCQGCDFDDCNAGCGPVCEDCDRGQECGLLDRICARRYVNPGPATGAITYPYYTTRGPRDFLMRSPRPLGP